MTTNLSFFLLLVVLAIATGHALLTWSVNWAAAVPLPLRIGAAYFTGITFYISVLRTCSAVFNHAGWSVWLTLAFSASLCAYYIKNIYALFQELLSKKSVLYVVSAALLCFPFFLVYWLPINSDSNHPFAFVGSLHSVRYAWISNFISECNYIPVLGQNTGQSILGFLGGTLSGKSPYVFLSLWLFSSIVFLGVFIYGVLNLYENRRHVIFFGVLLLMMGNTAFSLSHILVIDSGSPFALNGYTDTIFGVFSVLMLLLFHTELHRKKSSIIPLLIVVTLTCIANFFTAPQNMLYLLAVLPFLFLNSLRTKENIREPLLWTISLVIAALIAIPLGGMLTPKFLQSNIYYPGLMTVLKERGVHFSPGVPFYFGWGGAWNAGHGELGNLDNWKTNIVPIAWSTIQAFFTSVKILFFPIAGIFALYILQKRGGSDRRDELHSLAMPSFKSFWFLSAYTFVLGFLINFTITLNGYKWELSRFLIPGITLGMLGISLYTAEFLKTRQLHRVLIVAVLLLFITCGPILNLFLTTSKNMQNLSKYEPITAGFETFLGTGPEIDPAYSVLGKGAPLPRLR